MGLERESGVLAPGRRADLCVLDRHPLRESPDRVASTVVVQTWFGGALVYQKDAGSAP